MTTASLYSFWDASISVCPRTHAAGKWEARCAEEMLAARPCVSDKTILACSQHLHARRLQTGTCRSCTLACLRWCMAFSFSLSLSCFRLWWLWLLAHQNNGSFHACNMNLNKHRTMKGSSCQRYACARSSWFTSCLLLLCKKCFGRYFPTVARMMTVFFFQSGGSNIVGCFFRALLFIG